MSDDQENRRPFSMIEAQAFSPVTERKRFSIATDTNTSYGSTHSSPFITTPQIHPHFPTEGISIKPLATNVSYSYNDTYESVPEEALEIIDSLPRHFLPQLKLTPWRRSRDITASSLTTARHSMYGIANTKENEELKKELTSFKIQIRIFKEFIQELIRRTGHEHDELFQNELIDNFAEKTRVFQEKDWACEKCGSLEEKLQDSQRWIAHFKAVAEELQQSPTRVASDGWEHTADEILLVLAEWATGKSKDAIERVLRKPLGVKLEVVKLELYKILQHLELVLAQQRASIRTLDEDTEALIRSLSALNMELANQREASAVISDRLQREVQTSQELATLQKTGRTGLTRESEELDRNSTLPARLQLPTRLKLTPNTLPEQGVNALAQLRRDVAGLESDNDALRVLSDTLKLEKLQLQNDLDAASEAHSQHVLSVEAAAQRQINELRALISSSTAKIADLGDEDELLQSAPPKQNASLKQTNDELQLRIGELEALKSALAAEVAAAQQEVTDLTSRLRKSQEVRTYQEETFAARVRALTNQLETQEKETKEKTDELQHVNITRSYNERDLKRKVEELQASLDQAVDKQRSLGAEKVRLKYTIESLNSEKSGLAANIRNLTDKLTRGEPAAKSKEIALLIEQANNFEQCYEEMLTKDIDMADRFLQAFEKILDDTSLAQARSKLAALKSREDDLISAKKVRELHHALFTYYVVAVEAVVTDHVALLLKGSDINDAALHDLKASLEKPDDESELKLRIEELYTRWKKEREARVLESTASRERCDALETENAQLRKRLKEMAK
ncbi:hypothetical protein BABINDRAFT_159092 [Babjeviella inositovora NRRL Y-12698]|uniref:Mto2p-binding domain-containing protein n=1 Tax=Babjeviella inositovora NRRL Y-12698 TaxID=984486 RepID=A0A1E3QXW5_9ASCO|nr:uncharacterized protein BABINDRAFT_159092 [Babjeviella inositovora NRRL Y-12698]ODQ82520.1 hypothetical protein BABINDRAFT_159092 [Babjeviella inositovora NRRL Y-12698]